MAEATGRELQGTYVLLVPEGVQGLGAQVQQVMEAAGAQVLNWRGEVDREKLADQFNGLEFNFVFVGDSINNAQEIRIISTDLNGDSAAMMVGSVEGPTQRSNRIAVATNITFKTKPPGAAEGARIGDRVHMFCHDNIWYADCHCSINDGITFS